MISRGINIFLLSLALSAAAVVLLTTKTILAESYPAASCKSVGGQSRGAQCYCSTQDSQPINLTNPQEVLQCYQKNFTVSLSLALNQTQGGASQPFEKCLTCKNGNLFNNHPFSCPKNLIRDIVQDRNKGILMDSPKNICKSLGNYEPKIVKTPEQLEDFFSSTGEYSLGTRARIVSQPDCLPWRHALSNQYIGTSDVAVEESDRRLMVAEYYYLMNRLQNGTLISLKTISTIEDLLETSPQKKESCWDPRFPKSQELCKQISSCKMSGNFEALEKATTEGLKTLRQLEGEIQKMDTPETLKKEYRQRIQLLKSMLPWLRAKEFKYVNPVGGTADALRKFLNANREAHRDRLKKLRAGVRCINASYFSIDDCEALEDILPSTPPLTPLTTKEKNGQALRKALDINAAMDLADCRHNARQIKAESYEATVDLLLTEVIAVMTFGLSSAFTAAKVSSQVVRAGVTAASHSSRLQAVGSTLVNSLIPNTFNLGQTLKDSIHSCSNEITSSIAASSSTFSSADNCSAEASEFQAIQSFRWCVIKQTAPAVALTIATVGGGKILKNIGKSKARVTIGNAHFSNTQKGLKVNAQGQFITATGHKPYMPSDIDETLVETLDRTQPELVKQLKANPSLLAKMQSDPVTPVVRVVEPVSGVETYYRVLPNVLKSFEDIEKAGFKLAFFSNVGPERNELILKQIRYGKKTLYEHVEGRIFSARDIDPNLSAMLNPGKYTRRADIIKPLEKVVKKDLQNADPKLVNNLVKNSFGLEDTAGVFDHQIYIPRPQNMGPPSNWPFRREYIRGIMAEVKDLIKAKPGTTFAAALKKVTTGKNGKPVVDLTNSDNWNNNRFIRRGELELRKERQYELERAIFNVNN